MDFVKNSEESFTVNASFSSPVSEDCSEFIWLANTELHSKMKVASGTETATVTFNVPTTSEADVDFGGIKAFLTCSDMKVEIESIIDTAMAFINIEEKIRPLTVPRYMEDLSKQFLSETMGYSMEKRAINHVDVDPSTIKSGDFLGNVRLDGLSPIIMYGTGARFSHCLMALWFDDGLYIVESQGAGYWPVFGIQRTPWDEWIQLARARDYNTIWLPLKDDIAAKFDEKAAQDWFFQTEGLPYGFHNFIYGWMDTERDNLPPLLADEIFPAILALYEKVAPDSTYKMFTQGMNMRLGTDNFDLA